MSKWVGGLAEWVDDMKMEEAREAFLSKWLSDGHYGVDCVTALRDGFEAGAGWNARGRVKALEAMLWNDLDGNIADIATATEDSDAQ